MSAVHKLITDHLDIWTAADTEKKSGRGRASGNANSVYGIKKLRELILQLAVRGKLVPQDPNDEPASELLKRIHTERVDSISNGKTKKEKLSLPIEDEEKTFELPENWEWIRLSKVAEFVNGFAFSSGDFSRDGVGVVKIGDIQDGSITPESMSRVPFEVVRDLDVRLKVEPNELVIAMSGATTGKLGFNRTNQTFYLNQRVGKIVPFIVSREFLFLDLTTKIAANLAKSFGTAIPNLSTEQINAILIALPPLAEQTPHSRQSRRTNGTMRPTRSPTQQRRRRPRTTRQPLVKHTHAITRRSRFQRQLATHRHPLRHPIHHRIQHKRPQTNPATTSSHGQTRTTRPER